ncbi:MAG: twin-arginine translocation signal domain-containing protein [Acidobacteriota bacterium]|nr:twin-arginine translocation signal domain-containing protein [Acidobacteriota bacterium]
MNESNSINRRDFVKTASIAAASVLLANALPIAAQTNRKRRYAIISTGHRATGIAARTSIEKKRPVKIAELIRL